jgi:hypothetical protein
VDKSVQRQELEITSGLFGMHNWRCSLQDPRRFMTKDNVYAMCATGLYELVRLIEYDIDGNSRYAFDLYGAGIARFVAQYHEEKTKAIVEIAAAAAVKAVRS